MSGQNTEDVTVGFTVFPEHSFTVLFVHPVQQRREVAMDQMRMNLEILRRYRIAGQGLTYPRRCSTLQSSDRRDQLRLRLFAARSFLRSSSSRERCLTSGSIRSPRLFICPWIQRARRCM